LTTALKSMDRKIQPSDLKVSTTTKTVTTNQVLASKAPTPAPAQSGGLPVVVIAAGSAGGLLVVVGILIIVFRHQKNAGTNQRGRHKSEADVNDMYSVDVPNKLSTPGYR